MSKLPHCRLMIETEPHAGAWNMAVDEVLLESAIADGVATFRWYRWSEPTLSLGYFQNAAEVAADPQWAGLPKVRRLTGGGAILHHHEWTYSIALPARQSLVRQPEELYDLVHDAVAGCLRAHGLAAASRGETRKVTPEPFLCFSRRDAHDVVIGEHKILGSAQRRRKGALLQHGSLLMRSSAFAPQHFGIEELGLKPAWTPGEFEPVWQQLADEIEPAALTPREVAAVQAKLAMKDR